jgi:NAD(P)H-hydrate epimerase
MPVPVLSVAQMREWEKASWAAGQTEAEVIRRVGLATARLAMQLTHPSDLLVILAGKGHNGDDARCAKEQLAKRRVDVLEVADPGADLAKLEALLSLSPALLIDGLFGIGINRQLSTAWVEFLNRINAAQLRVLAVDVPSGLDADTGRPWGAAIRAAVTLTVGAPKIGLLTESAWEYVGRLQVSGDVGLAGALPESDLQWSLPHDYNGFPPDRQVAGHKGTYGHLGIISGSLGFHGAAVLAARGAQRAQPGLITLHTLESVYHVIASQLQAVMVSPWRSETKPGENRTALLIGPGLAGPDVPEQMKMSVPELWQRFPGPLVIDASALAWVPPATHETRGLRVITPHPGEAARMLGCQTAEVQADRVEAVRALSRRFSNCWVVLKGHQTLIGRKEDKVFVNCSGNPHLAQGGSGDLLSGYLAGLLAQPALQGNPAMTLRYGVWQHGAAADLLQQKQPNWVVEDLATHIGLGPADASAEFA